MTPDGRDVDIRPAHEFSRHLTQGEQLGEGIILWDADECAYVHFARVIKPKLPKKPVEVRRRGYTRASA